MFKKIISIVLLVAIANSMYLMNVKAENTIYVDGIEFRVESNEAEEAVVYTVMENGDKVYANIDKNSNEIEAEVIDYPVNVVGIGLGKPEVTEYELKVEQENTGETEIQIVNTETNESVTINSDNDVVEAQDAAALPQSYVELAKLLAILAALSQVALIIAAGLAVAITIGGVAYYTIEGVKEYLKKNKPEGQYFKAQLKKKVMVYIDFEHPMTKLQAVDYLLEDKNNNIFAIKKELASAACAGASPIKLPFGPERHLGEEGQYYHFHPRTSIKYPKDHAANHCWY